MNIFGWFGNLFSNLFSKVNDAWDRFSPWLKAFVASLFGSALGAAIEILYPIVSEILIAIQVDPEYITNEDRRNEAFKRIENAITGDLQVALIRLGFSSLTMLINLAIESVLAYLKQQGAMPPNAGAGE